MPNQLAAFAAKQNKKFGDNLAPLVNKPRDVLSTTSLTLDWALRKGGLEMGAIYEILGPPGCFKTSMAIRMMAEARHRWPERAVSYIDLEKTFRDEWAADHGLDSSDAAIAAGTFNHTYPETSEDASDLSRMQAGSGLFSLIVIDSVGGMESKKAFAKEAGEAVMGNNAQVITRMSKALATLTRQHECAIVMINQPRANLSGGYSDLSAGPKALQHATTAKITMKLIGGADGIRKMKFGDSEEPVSKQVRAIVDRLKYGTEGRRAEFWFNVQESGEYGPIGVNEADEYATMGIRYGVIAREGKGSYYVVPGADKVNGKPAVIKLLRGRPDLLEGVRAGVLAADPEAEALETFDIES